MVLTNKIYKFGFWLFLKPYINYDFFFSIPAFSTQLIHLWSIKVKQFVSIFGSGSLCWSIHQWYWLPMSWSIYCSVYQIAICIMSSARFLSNKTAKCSLKDETQHPGGRWLSFELFYLSPQYPTKMPSLSTLSIALFWARYLLFLVLIPTSWKKKKKVL